MDVGVSLCIQYLYICVSHEFSGVLSRHPRISNIHIQGVNEMVIISRFVTTRRHKGIVSCFNFEGMLIQTSVIFHFSNL